MANPIKVLVYPVQDVEKAKAFYTTFLGTEPYVDTPYYIGYRVGDIEVGLDPNATEGPIAYIEVEDIKASIVSAIEVGAVVVQDPKDVGGGMLVAQIKDAADSIVGFRQLP